MANGTDRIFFFFRMLQKYSGTLIGTDCSLPEYEPNVFLMSVILFLGTFITSVILKDFKNALFFPSKVSAKSIFFVYFFFCFIKRFLKTEGFLDIL